jgi:hypothetical protein
VWVRRSSVVISREYKNEHSDSTQDRENKRFSSMEEAPCSVGMFKTEFIKTISGIWNEGTNVNKTLNYKSKSSVL